MKNFEQALDFCLRHETVYAKGHYGDLQFAIPEEEANDPGGFTFYGLDKRSHPQITTSLTLTEATEIYFTEYWEKAHCAEMVWPLSQVHFDGCVNVGIGQQTKFIQRAAAVYDDGAWGPNTKRALMAAVNDVGAVQVARHVCSQKKSFYRELVARKPVMARFLQGWLNRLNDLRSECGLD